MWKTVKLGEVCNFQNGRAFKKSEWSETGLPIIRIQNLKNETTEHNFYDGEYDERIFIENGDLLLSWSGTVKPFIWCHGDALLNQHVFKVTVSKELNQGYALYLFQNILNEISKQKVGIGLQHITKKTFENFPVTLPPLEEQQRIVAKLDAAFAEIDRAIEIATEKQQQSEQLVDTALDEIANLEGESVSLAQVCSIEAALVSPTENPYRHQKHIGAGNIISFSNQLVDVMTAEEEKLSSGKYPFNKSSVLYSKIRPYLRKVHLPEFEGICSADMYPLVPNTEKLTREFLFYLLLSNHFTNYAISGSARAGMPKVNRNHLFAYEFALPSITIQNAFAEKMAKILSHTRNLNAVYQSQIDELKVLKSAILAQELQPQQSEAA